MSTCRSFSPRASGETDVSARKKLALERMLHLESGEKRNLSYFLMFMVGDESLLTTLYRDDSKKILYGIPLKTKQDSMECHKGGFCCR